MLSFAFDDEQEQFRKELVAFAAKELAPHYRRRAAVAEFPWDAHRRLGDLGVLGIGIPAEYGGTGDPDPITLGMAVEALSYGDVNVGAGPIYVGLVAAQIAAHGSAEVCGEWLPRIVAGTAMVAIAVTEPAAGSDVSGLLTTARQVPGGYRISGEKIAISHAITAQAALVYAREPGSTGHQGISCFLVPLDADGVERRHMPGMGALPLGWGGLAFTDVFVPDTHLVGEPGRGFAGAMSHFDFSRPAIGLACLGAAQASIDETVEWSLQRQAFGRPIAAFQGVTFPIAEHATFLEAARWLCYRSLWTRDAGGAHTSYAAMCKWWPPQVAKDAIETAMVTFGNIGYSTESPLQQRYRDVCSYLIGDGTAGIQKRIIATSLFGRVAAS
ncbi:acyl-CoA dehydrogenase [Nakamurella sp. YIM 132087]|uniref:Acyl-CoA dehydrogenase n=1 Tax=Nakamurella alba TaxID=2665158 RepID=A0A7K1FEI8_9ACTN|nr:acyl-CoA dehydrogenase [Nakamurella alba]